MKDKEGQVKVSQKRFFFLLVPLVLQTEINWLSALLKEFKSIFLQLVTAQAVIFESHRLTSLPFSGMFPY